MSDESDFEDAIADIEREHGMSFEELNNMPSAMCVRCINNVTEYIVEFRDLKNDVTRSRSLCRECAEAMLIDI